jgi:hypothetical protein
MQRMNLGEVPDDVDAVLVAATEGCRQSLSAFVVDRLIEVAQAVCVPDWVATYPAPRGTGVTADDVVAGVGAVCEASWARLSAPCCGEAPSTATTTRSWPCKTSPTTPATLSSSSD